MKKGKRYLEISKLVEKNKLYDLPEAVAILKKTANAKFDETVEAHLKLGVDGRHADQQVRGAVVLPHGDGPVGRPRYRLQRTGIGRAALPRC